MDEINKNSVFEIENEEEFRKKQELKAFREKEEFYKTHSKFATYIDPDYLRIFELELVSFSDAFLREADKNMGPETDLGTEGHSTTRLQHSLDLAEFAENVGERLLLNKKLLRIGGLFHDLGHFAFAHDGEKMFSEYLESMGICKLPHPVIAWLVEKAEKIHEKTIKRLQEEKQKTFTEEELKQYDDYKKIITNIAAAHNGEGVEYDMIPDKNLSWEEIEEQYIKACVEKGQDRKISCKTVEGLLVKRLDLISYVGKDFETAVRGKTDPKIDVNDKEYEQIFIKLGIPKETLDEWAKGREKKDKIVEKVSYILMDNLVQCSRGINGVRMSKNATDAMYELRHLNYLNMVIPRTRKIMNILPERIPELIDRYTGILMRYEKSKSKEEETNSYRTGMRSNITGKLSAEEIEIYEEITKRGIENYVRKEIDEIIEGKSETITQRRKRFETDLKILKEQGEITEDVKETYVQRILKEINLTPEESENMLVKRIKLQYPNTNPERIEELVKQNSHLRLDTLKECLAKLKVTMYIGSSSNTYLIKMLRSEGLLTEEEEKTRFEYGGDPKHSRVGDTIKEQADEIKEQANAIKEQADAMKQRADAMQEQADALGER